MTKKDNYPIGSIYVLLRSLMSFFVITTKRDMSFFDKHWGYTQEGHPECVWASCPSWEMENA